LNWLDVGVCPSAGFGSRHGGGLPIRYHAFAWAATFALSGAALSWLIGGRSTDRSSFPLTSIALREMMRSMAVKKNPNAVALGKLGGIARASSLTHAERSDIAKKAAAARNASLSAEKRTQIAKLAVKAREQKRKESRKEN
jgi:hypothetical protein